MKLLFNQNLRVIILIASLALITESLFCQDSEPVQTLFNKDTKLGYQWSPALKFNSIQGDIGSLIEINGGLLLNNSTMIGLAGGVNFGHPRVNYGFFGMIAQYIFSPNKLFHLSGQTVFAYGTTKDYEQEKSSLFDNFWNISGTSYYLIEPGINLEINLKENMRFVTGLSYRFVTGLDEDNQYVSLTHVTNKDMSGINIKIGLIFNGGKKQ
jgi:hypothetical protein